MSKLVKHCYLWALPLLTFGMVGAIALVDTCVAGHHRLFMNTCIAIAIGLISFIRLVNYEPSRRKNWGFKFLNFIYGTINLVAMLLAIVGIAQNGIIKY